MRWNAQTRPRFILASERVFFYFIIIIFFFFCFVLLVCLFLFVCLFVRFFVCLLLFFCFCFVVVVVLLFFFFWGGGGVESESMLTLREKSPLLEKFSPEECRTHDAASNRTASPAHYLRAIPAPDNPFDLQLLSKCGITHTYRLEITAPVGWALNTNNSHTVVPEIRFAFCWDVKQLR